VNNDNTDDETADKHYAMGASKEVALCQLLTKLKVRSEKLCPDELMAIDDLILEASDPPEFADSFKSPAVRTSAEPSIA
jgi:hypothetical protein